MNCVTDIDGKWLKELKKGEAKAFELLFDRYHRLLYGLAFRYFQSDADAQDAVQHALIRIWEKRNEIEFTNEATLRSLLYTILKHYILNELRHRRIVEDKHQELFTMFQTDAEESSCAFEQQELKNHLYSEIEKLPHQKREICKMKVLKGMKNQEIADVMNLSVPTVKTHYSESIKRLRRGLDKWLVWVLFFIS
ncbi:MAG: RNA polymerase sigma-70 factor [Bacteroidia bacterium]|nr:RNA polymerase sigma-70 factor [Bacteroidia bacterium]